MARLIAVANPKGGAGKSTLTTNLAGAFHHRGRRTLIANGDPNGFVTIWRRRRVPAADLPDVPAGIEPYDRDALRALRAQPYDVVVIDGPSRPRDGYAALLTTVDLLLVPAQPSAPDQWALQPFVDAVLTRHDLTGGLPSAAIVLSRVNPRRANDDNRFEPIESLSLPCLESRMCQRVSYAKAAYRAETVFEPCDLSRAAQEIWVLGTETLARVDNTPPLP
jgi:chromosome partitioning protein